MSRHSKRRKLESSLKSRPPGIFKLPWEILEQILSYCSPGELLAISRCSRIFCYILTSPDTAVMWKEARERDIIPLPPPLDLPEPAYAAFLYDDDVVCEVR